MNLETTARILEGFSLPELLGAKIDFIERAYVHSSSDDTSELQNRFGLQKELFEAAARMKEASRQIDVLIHAVGILLSLPYILESDEIVEYLSLGAGSSGKVFDLETNKRVAEFKFITWRGGSESTRKKQLFKDLFYLTEYDKPKQRYLYLLEIDIPVKFLKSSKGKIVNMLNRNDAFKADFKNRHGARFEAVKDYYAYAKGRVQIVDLLPLVPDLRGIRLEQLAETIEADTINA
jgi:hypothetical protein